MVCGFVIYLEVLVRRPFFSVRAFCVSACPTVSILARLIRQQHVYSQFHSSPGTMRPPRPATMSSRRAITWSPPWFRITANSRRRVRRMPCAMCLAVSKKKLNLISLESLSRVRRSRRQKGRRQRCQFERVQRAHRVFIVFCRILLGRRTSQRRRRRVLLSCAQYATRQPCASVRGHQELYTIFSPAFRETRTRCCCGGVYCNVYVHLPAINSC